MGLLCGFPLVEGGSLVGSPLVRMGGSPLVRMGGSPLVRMGSKAIEKDRVAL